ncbi:MAG: DUF4388 domain-containing protein [Actinomycetes bacterium]
MKLEGSLDTFSLADIVTLLSTTKKSGGLHMSCQGARGVVYFRDGQVVAASADEGRQSLARRLIGSGAVDDAALTAAIQTALSSSGAGVGTALLESGGIDPELLCQAATEQTVDAVFDLLGWVEGEFAFGADEPAIDDVGIRLDSATVVAETAGRRAAWDSVSSVIPSLRSVVAMPVVLTADPQVSRDEWALLALADGHRTITDLVDLTGAGQFAAISTVASLVERGLLQVHEHAGTDHASLVERRTALLAPLEHARATRVRAPDVVPSRGEPFRAPRRPEHPDDAVGGGVEVTTRPGMPMGSPVPQGVGGGSGAVVGSAAMAADPSVSSLIERDPAVNRSLLLRLIAGVRGL